MLEETEFTEKQTALAVDFAPAIITADFTGMEKALAERLADYDGLTPEAIRGVDAKELKPLRAELKRWSTELNDARKAIKRAYNEPLNAFEAGCKRLDAMILEPCNIIDAEIKRQENEQRDVRYANLEDEYRDFCDGNGVSALMENVPFDRILEPQWLNKSFGEVKAKNALMDKVAAILADWRSVQAGQYTYPDEAEACYFRTLSLREVTENDNRLKAEREAVRALQEETGYSREPETAPEPVREEPRRTYRLTIDCEITLSEYDKALLIDVFNQFGIHGKLREVANV